MKGRGLIIFALIAAAVSVLVVAGCGGSSSSSSDSTSAEGNPSAAFLGSTEGRAFVALGHEAGDAEREAASKVLSENSKARAVNDYAEQCKTLSKRMIVTLEEQAEFIFGHKTSCPAQLQEEAVYAPAYVLADSMDGPIDVLRVEGNKGAALYHGLHNKDYGIPMLKEGGEWKVDHLAPLLLAKPKNEPKPTGESTSTSG